MIHYDTVFSIPPSFFSDCPTATPPAHVPRCAGVPGVHSVDLPWAPVDSRAAAHRWWRCCRAFRHQFCWLGVNSCRIFLRNLGWKWWGLNLLRNVWGDWFGDLFELVRLV